MATRGQRTRDDILLPKHLLAPVGLAAVAALAIGACGSDQAAPEPEVICGPGTMKVGNVCFAGGSGGADASAGSGGTAGAGTGGTGGAGATSGSGNAGAGTAGAGTGGGGGLDGAAGAAPDGSAGDGAADADATKVEGGPNPGDDPCPTEPIYLNCSDSCGPKSPECVDLVCGGHFYTKQVKDPGLNTWFWRTPSKPGWDPKCAGVCANAPTASSVEVHFSIPGVKDDAGITHHDYWIRVTVAAPWRIKIAYSDFVGNICADGEAVPGCDIGSDSNAWVVVTTDDPNAPARNVKIERLLKPVVCQ